MLVVTAMLPFTSEGVREIRPVSRRRSNDPMSSWTFEEGRESSVGQSSSAMALGVNRMLNLETMVGGSADVMSARPKPERRCRFDLELNLRESMRMRRVGLYGAVAESDNDVLISR